MNDKQLSPEEQKKRIKAYERRLALTILAGTVIVFGIYFLLKA